MGSVRGLGGGGGGVGRGPISVKSVNRTVVCGVDRRRNLS